MISHMEAVELYNMKCECYKVLLSSYTGGLFMYEDWNKLFGRRRIDESNWSRLLLDPRSCTSKAMYLSNQHHPTDVVVFSATPSLTDQKYRCCQIPP
ncbi:hypothetical protein RB195_000670 [Necator americanus]|uniref:Uncharacterized protein n=1 Tax=Necator americanus TaxID=51031 RepID=A0ABR1DAU3_NECAM